MKSFFYNPCNRYLFLWGLYHLKGFLYPDGSIINQSILLLIMLVSFKEVYWFLKHEDISNNAFFKGLNTLMLMYIVYGLLLFITDGVHVISLHGDSYSSLVYIQGALCILMPIYVVYLYTKRGFLTRESLQKWMMIFLGVGICQYYTLQADMMRKFLANGIDRTEFHTGGGYILLSLIPGMLVYNRKLLSYIGIGVCIVYILMGMKRGAIIVAALSILLIMWRDIKIAKGGNKLAVILLVALSCALLTKFVGHMLDTSAYFNSRLEATLEGDSSDRDVIYNTIWHGYLYESNVVQFIFGRGALGTLKYANIYAHNDWLEIIFCNGIVGIFIFINYWKGLLVTARSASLCEASRFCLYLILCMFFVKSLFSMSIIGMPIYTTTMLGFALADGFNENKSNKAKY